MHANPTTGDRFLFICQGSGIGIFNLNATLTDPSQFINISPSGISIVATCSVRSFSAALPDIPPSNPPRLIPIGFYLPILSGPNRRHLVGGDRQRIHDLYYRHVLLAFIDCGVLITDCYALPYSLASDLLDYTQPWLASASQYTSVLGTVYTSPAGAGFFVTASRGLIRFTASPAPTTIATTNSLTLGNNALALNLPSSSTLLGVNGFAVIQYPSSGSNITIEAILLSEVTASQPTTFASVAADQRTSSRVFWAAICSGGTATITRFYLDATTTQLNPTHEGIFNQGSDYTSFPCGTGSAHQVLPGVVDTVHGVVMTFPSYGFVMFTRMFSCGSSTTCGQCSLDRMYCDWCVSPSGGSCVNKGTCTASHNISLTACPTLTTSTPSSVSTMGATTLVVTGASFNVLQTQTTALGGLYCLVGNSALSPATVVSSTLLSCTVEPLSISGALTLTLALNNSIPLDPGTSLPLSVYNCSASTTCASCATSSQPDCVWCASDGICNSRLDPYGVCPTSDSPLISFGSTGLHCASLNTISPSSVPVHFTTNASLPQIVTLTAPFANLTGNWQCAFLFPTTTLTTAGSLNYISATDSTVVCPISPYGGTFGPGVTSVTVPVEVLLNGKPYTPNALSIVYYNCSRFTMCTTCAANQYCGWSLASTQCGAQISGTTTSCPTAGLSPLSTLGTSTTPLTISGGPFVSSTSYTCGFGSPINQNVSATFVSGSSLTCSAPASAVSDPFDSQVTVFLNGALYVPAGPLRYYTCFPSTLICTHCANPLHIGCSWCRTSSTCNTTTALQASCPSLVTGQCPNITSVSPSLGAITGNLAVTLTGALLDASGTYTCLFLGPETSSSPVEYLHSTTSVPTATSAACVTPDVSASGPGPYDVTLQYNDTHNNANNLSSVALFDFIDCHQMTNCSGCTATSQCQWCIYDSTCRFTASEGCTLGTTYAITAAATCPLVTNVSPAAAASNQMTPITITGTNLNRAGVSANLQCLLDSVHLVEAAFISSSGGVDVFQCNTSLGSVTGTAPFQLEVSLGTPVIYALWPDGNGNANNFTFYDCTAASTCDQCTALNSKYCGWCSSDHACTAQSTCSAPSTWAQPGCPRVTSLSLNAADAVSVGKPFVVTVAGLTLSGAMSLDCLFSTLTTSLSTPVTSVDLQSGQVTCNVGQSPNNSTFIANVSVSLVNSATMLPFTTNIGDSFFDPASTLEYIQCSVGGSEDSCGQCLSTTGLDSRCGWCVYSGGCGVSTSCYVGSPITAWQSATSQCPSVASISPTTGPSTGNTLITITGTNFIQNSANANGPALFCSFDGQMTAAVFVTTTEIQCTTPSVNVASGAVKSLQFSLLMRQPTVSAGTGSTKRASTNTTSYVVFASTPTLSFTFDYVAPPKSTNLSWIAAPVVILVLLIAVLIVVLVFLRRRHIARRLTPPDFNKYAFSANTRLIREVAPERRDKLSEIVPLLSESSYKFSLALRTVTSGSDDELLCRALVYASYPNSFALDMLIHFIETEVEHCEQVGELFRSSSIACKMYTIYSKIVGIQYLWKTLARSIHTLDDAGQSEDKRLTVGDKSSAPPSTGQVSMMDLGSLEVDPERLAERLEKEVDEAVMADVSIYQLELLLKTSRIFKRVVDSVNSVPRELRMVAKRVKMFVTSKFPQDEMDYKGVNAFFFLRFICPAVMTPQIYGVLEHPPGETSQRYFVLISKTLQNLANGTLPSSKESYMAKMDEFVVDNKVTLHRFIDRLCSVQDHGIDGESVALDDANEHNARDVRLMVNDEIYYSSLSFLQSHYMEHRAELLQIFRGQHDDEFADRLDRVMHEANPTSATAPATAESSTPNKKKKKREKSKE